MTGWFVDTSALMRIEHLTPAIEDRAIEVRLLLTDLTGQHSERLR